jgi:3D (Asp-Asp-Asp) domain-containing protein
MRPSGSSWPKAVVAALTVGGALSLYQVTFLDSRAVAGLGGSPDAAVILEPGAQLRFTATAYCKGQVTRSGVPPRAGIAAADPKLLPIGSIVEVDSAGSEYDGVYSVLDTGPAVRGPILDLYIWSCHEALRFGRQSVEVRVLRLGWDPAATAPRSRPFARLLGPGGAEPPPVE